MTDKKTGDMDKDFNLNHFEQADEHESEKNNVLVETESFYTADLFAETEQPEAEEKAGSFDATWDADRFAEPGDEKKEPSIPQQAESTANTQTAVPKPGPHKQQRMPDNEPEPANIAPPVTDNPSSALPAEQRSGTKPITIFAILAMLVAAIAVWLNPGVGSDEPTPVKAVPVLAEDIQMQQLEIRISSLEQQNKQQNDALKQQMDKLQQQVSRLSSQLSKQAGKQQRTRHPETTAVRRKSARPRASTAPVSTHSSPGWVVNLVSVDSKHAAVKALGSYKAQGISAEIFPAKVKGKTWYRLRITGFANKQEAVTQKKYLAVKHGIKNAWVQKP